MYLCTFKGRCVGGSSASNINAESYLKLLLKVYPSVNADLSFKNGLRLKIDGKRPIRISYPKRPY